MRFFGTLWIQKMLGGVLTLLKMRFWYWTGYDKSTGNITYYAMQMEDSVN